MCTPIPLNTHMTEMKYMYFPNAFFVILHAATVLHAYMLQLQICCLLNKKIFFFVFHYVFTLKISEQLVSGPRFKTQTSQT